MARAGKIVLNLALLRLLLDLPEAVSIVEVRQTEGNKALNVCELIVSSPYCPVWPEGGEIAELRLVYRNVSCRASELEKIIGLDT